MIGKNCYFFIHSGGKIKLGDRVIISDYVELQAKGNLSIGNFTTINRNSRIIAYDTIRIGNNVTIAQFVSILDHDHAYDILDGKLTLNDYDTAPITVGDNVWIADKCTLLKGIAIGNNVIIGANTLVNKDVPDNCIIRRRSF